MNTIAEFQRLALNMPRLDTPSAEAALRAQWTDWRDHVIEADRELAADREEADQ